LPGSGSPRVVEKDAGGQVLSSQLYYYLTDHASTLLSTSLGSTAQLLNGSNGIVSGSTARYLPYGRYRTSPTQTITDRDFTGQKENRELGLLYYNARFYVPGIGRFASADSLVPDPANPQSYNRYSYVRNQPLNRVDTTGRWDCAQDENYEACMSTIQAWLDWLANGDEISRGLYLWFMAFDEQWIAENGFGVLFEFKNMRGAKVPICGGATGVCGWFRDPEVNFSLGMLNDTDISQAALFGHELVHLWQGDRWAWSILGEAEAYYTQGKILQEFNQQVTGYSQEIMDRMKDGLTQREHYQFADYLRSNVWEYNLSPMYPIGFSHIGTVDLAPFVQGAQNQFTYLSRQESAIKAWQALQSLYGME
jgi:RHS repeat-associated protein